MLVDLELKQLRALHAVATEGSFARAASRLGFTQSAVSQQIAALERVVGDRVLDRPGGPRPAVLTPVGEVVLAHATDVLARQDELGRALRELRAGQIGRISVGTFQSVSVRILPEVLGRLRAERPRLDIRCGEIDLADDAAAAVRAGEYDIAFLVGDTDDDLEAIELLTDPYVLLAPPHDHRTTVSLVDLDGLPMIGQYGNACQVGMERALQAQGLQLHYVFRSNDNAAVQAMVRADMGYAVMPRLAIDAADPGVNVIPLDHLVAPRVIRLVRPRDRTVNAAVDRFVELALDVVAALAERTTAATLAS